MPQTKLATGKKRNATSKLQEKHAKTLKFLLDEEQVILEVNKCGMLTKSQFNKVEDEQKEGLFDNLDDQMDTNELNNIMEILNEGHEDEEGYEDESEDDKDYEDHNKDIEEEGQNSEQVDDKTLEVEEHVSVKKQNTSTKFRDLYMTRITQAFGTDLDQIRLEPNLSGPRLSILIDSLEAGIDIFSNLEQEIILANEQQ
ncbi:hypothetical protein [Parasitella parasitica]|uniref:Ribosome assembly protein 3 n=1 Tax=Parasitella parasitica TaxID=35722 RepID=A0A0B7N9P3_9FUNG|nr:hypothetical protein [Parasitella parasitica]